VADATPAAGPAKSRWGGVAKNIDLAFTFGLLGVVSLLILPVPPAVMDFFLALSIGISLLTLMMVVYIKDPPEFNVFPTLLLAVTLFRLGLNIATTRLILIEGYAGKVIESFGSFVVQGNFVVGAVIFIILVIINFVVITKGAGRIAEVTARFTLDAMPGKQMAIDAELNAGLIDEPTARRRRESIMKESDFYGAMDGASKFVRGDAVAGILITMVNVVGGISIGVLQRGLSLTDSLQKYTLLSIGDGLVSQIPALIISVAAGILVTRSSDNNNLGTHMGKQLTSYPRALGIAGIMLLMFAVMPGLPFVPFALLGGCLVAISRLLAKKGPEIWGEEGDEAQNALPGGKAGQPALPGEAEEAESEAKAEEKSFSEIIATDSISVELGYNLLPLANVEKGGSLLERITGIRKGIAAELGLILPTVAVRDNLELEANAYRLLIRGRVVGEGTLMPNRWMAMNVGGEPVELRGVPTVEPAFGLEAVWVTEEERRNAEIQGYTVVDSESVLITHLSENLKTNAHLLLEREDVQRLIEEVRAKSPTLVNELLPDLVNVGLIQRVLQNLLSEKIPIRNLPVILETIADFAPVTKNPDDLSEQVRRRLGRYFVAQYEVENHRMFAITLDPMLEQQLLPRVKRTQFEIGLAMDPSLTDHILKTLAPKVDQMIEQGMVPILLITAELRLAFRRFFEPSFPQLHVLAYQELPNETQVEAVGYVPAPLSAQQAQSANT